VTIQKVYRGQRTRAQFKELLMNQMQREEEEMNEEERRREERWQIEKETEKL